MTVILLLSVFARPGVWSDEPCASITRCACDGLAGQSGRGRSVPVAADFISDLKRLGRLRIEFGDPGFAQNKVRDDGWVPNDLENGSHSEIFPVGVGDRRYYIFKWEEVNAHWHMAYETKRNGHIAKIWHARLRQVGASRTSISPSAGTLRAYLALQGFRLVLPKNRRSRSIIERSLDEKQGYAEYLIGGPDQTADLYFISPHGLEKKCGYWDPSASKELIYPITVPEQKEIAAIGGFDQGEKS